MILYDKDEAMVDAQSMADKNGGKAMVYRRRQLVCPEFFVVPGWAGAKIMWPGGFEGWVWIGEKKPKRNAEETRAG